MVFGIVVTLAGLYLAPLPLLFLGLLVSFIQALVFMFQHLEAAAHLPPIT